MLGQPLMPWQRYVADVGGELLPNGQPAYREIIVTVPRQSGKTTLFLSWQLDRCLGPWGRPQRSVFTAQTGKDARDKWLDEIYPLLEHSKLRPLITAMNRGMGNEGIEFTTGSRIRLLSTSATTGHGKTLHQAVMDEIWHDVDDRREQGLRPAMITQPDAQLLVCSTAGTAASTLYNRKVKTGRRAVAEDVGSGVAYFEWSAPDDWTVDQVGRLPDFHPAVGHTQTIESLAAELQSMEPDEALRAYGNRPTAGTDQIWPPELWARVCSAAAAPEGRIRFGVDVAEDRSSASVTAAAGGVAEVIECRPGTGWVVDRVNELTRRTPGSTAVRDGKGPARTLEGFDDIEEMSSTEVLDACSQLHDAVVEGRVQFRTDPDLDKAVQGAVKRQVGDLWVWSRKASTNDVTPLMAATLALYRPSGIITLEGSLGA